MDDAASAQILAGLPWRDRGRVRLYLSRLGEGEASHPQDDRAMSLLLRGGALKLPRTRLSRLQDLHAKAIGAAVAG